MQDLFLFIVCMAVTTFIGWNVFSLLSRNKEKGDFSGLETIGLSFLLGFGAVTLQMFIMGILGANLSRVNILVPWIAVVALNLLLPKKNLKSSIAPKLAYSKGEITLFVLIALQASYNFLRAVLKPIEAYDSVAIYGLKAKVIYFTQSLGSDFFANIGSYFHGAHPDYPLFISLSESWVYTFLGNFNDFIVKAIFPLFYVSFIFIFYAIVKRITKDNKLAVLFMFLLATVKQFSDYSIIGVSDMELGIFFAISAAYFYIWTINKRKACFINLSLVGTILCLWTKNEGMLLSLIMISIVLLYLFINFKKVDHKVNLRMFSYVFIASLAILAWLLFKKYNGFTNENFNLSMISISSFFDNFKKIPSILYEYQKHLFGFKKWNIIWILWILVWIKEFKAAFSKDIKYITLIFILFGLGYSAMYIFSAVEIKFFLSATGSRFLLHILPLAVFWMAILVSKTKLLEGYYEK